MVMNNGQINLTNFLVVQLFRHQLYVVAVELFVALGLLVLLGALVSGRLRQFNLSAAGLSEPRSRTYLRWLFGLIWLVDGILQFQPGMPLGLANNVVAPAMAGTPGWLHSLMQHAINVWNQHPLHLAVGTAWIQVGIGLVFLLSNGLVSRAAALVSVGWAAMIWFVGNGAGGIFTPGNSVLFGWPGATLFYVVAGVFLVFTNERFSKYFTAITLRFVGVVLALGALRQCLPSTGFWQGGNANALTTMSQTMTQSAQPHWVSWIALHGGKVAGQLGGGANIAIILWLLVSAVGLWMAPTRRWNWPVWTTVAGALFFWFVAQDAAFWGGVATDFNSLVPLAALTLAAAPRFAAQAPIERRAPQELRSLSGGVLVSIAFAMIVYSVGLMGWSVTQPTENTFFVATNGYASGVNSAAPSFTLRDQHGVSYHLGGVSDHYTVLTFLDPVCWTDCPLLAAQIKAVRAAFGPNVKLDTVGVAANPLHETEQNVQSFVAQHQLNSVPGFHFVDGPLATLRSVWRSWGISVENVPTSKMSVHSDFLFVIDPRGHLRWIIPDDPGSGATATQDSDVAETVALLHQIGLS